MSNNIEYGDKVTCSDKYFRVVDRKEGWNKKWKRYRDIIPAKMDQINGIFLGYRTLANGYVNFCSDEGYYFTPKEYIKAALVSPGPARNPVYVPIDAMEKV